MAGVRQGEAVVADDRSNVACGRPLPAMEVGIVDPTDGVGGIRVRCPALFSGYFDAPEATARVLRDGWLYTGDVGRLDAEGRVYVLGRRRAMLKRGGVPLAPRELEEAAERLPTVRAAAAVPGSSGDASEEIVLVVEPAPGPGPAPAELAATAAEAVAGVLGFGPSRIVVLAPRSIPRTGNGKVRHAVLAEALATGELEARGAILLSTWNP